MGVREGDGAAVVVAAVNLDREPRAAPEEIDLEAPDADVDLGARQGVALAEGKELELVVAAGRWTVTAAPRPNPASPAWRIAAGADMARPSPRGRGARGANVPERRSRHRW